jgi:hypothetical protein
VNAVVGQLRNLPDAAADGAAAEGAPAGEAVS